MTHDFMVVEKVQDYELYRVLSHGFVTESGAENEAEAFDRDVEVLSYHHEVNPDIYYNGDRFFSTFTWAIENAG